MSDWHDWHVGQTVVCVDGTRYPRCGYGQEIMPSKGSRYTIRAIIPPYNDGPIGFLLNEIINAPDLYEEGFVEPSFSAIRFRPVVIPEADIAQFEAILRGVEKRRLVDA